ncbi:MAG: hypothetical protein JWM57_1204 [Phycisphaerales bacterium]|nr:hypothetical protein [Phycisphaerales bacterium]
MKSEIQKKRTHGMATVMAVVVIGLLASVLTATAARAVIEQRRSAATGLEAQASRLLAAATQIARQQIADAKPTDGPIEMPLGHATLAWHGASAERSCDVAIDLGPVKRAATLAFADGRIIRVD